MALFFLFVAAILVSLSWYRRSGHNGTVEIIYEEDRDPLIRQLNLG